MKDIDSILKKLGYFNSILLVIAIVLKVITIIKVPLIIKIDSAFCIIALIFGLMYSLKGYKKDNAKYYKSFMLMYFVSSAISFISSLMLAVSDLGKLGIVMIISNLIILISVLVLALIKNFGENKSLILAILIFLINVFKLFFDIAIKGMNTSIFSAGFANLILACILCAFVIAKYLDKASRGTK